MPIRYSLVDLTAGKEAYQRVGWFMRREGDKVQCGPRIPDHARLSFCCEAIVAEDQDEIVGVATLAPAGSIHRTLPVLDTLAVTASRRCQGIGTELLRRAINAWAQGDASLACDPTNAEMSRLIESLPDDLRRRLAVQLVE